MRESTFGNLLSQYAPDELRNPLFVNLRVFIDRETIWFIGSEVASIMGYSDTDQAIRKNVPDQYKILITKNDYNFIIPSIRRDDHTWRLLLISELGLYALAMRSRLPQAYQFQDWVYRVISRIRQSGGYISPDPRLKQIVDIIPEHLRDTFYNMYDRVNKQQSTINTQNKIIYEQQNYIEDYQEMIDCNNINKMAELEEKNEVYKMMIHDYETALGEKSHSHLSPSTLERMKNIV